MFSMMIRTYQGPGKTKVTVSQVNGAVREDHFVVSGRSRGLWLFQCNGAHTESAGYGLRLPHDEPLISARSRGAKSYRDRAEIKGSPGGNLSL